MSLYPSREGGSVKYSDLLIVNSFLYRREYFKGSLSYKRRDTSVLESDLCLCKSTSLYMIRGLHVHLEVRGSDQTPISLTFDINELLQRPTFLGQMYQPLPRTSVCKLRKSASYKKVDAEEFMRKQNQVELSTLMQDSNIDEAISIGYDIIMEAAMNCARETGNASGEWTEACPTWSKILQLHDN